MKPERHEPPVLRVATYNIHKCVQGIGLVRGLEIHILGHAVEQPTPTYPSRLPLNQLEHVDAWGLMPVHAMVPSGRIWQRMSDHLPLVAEFAWND